VAVEIIRLTADNAATLGRVATDVFDEPVDPARVAAYLREPGHHLILAVADGLVVGQCAAVIHRHPDKPTELYIDEVGVAPAWQRQGIARRMLAEMFALGRSLGCEEAWVGTETGNVAALRLYEGFGGKAGTFVMFEYEFGGEA
jgi:aminoglycoside 6'-N-acetyltransferase I